MKCVILLIGKHWTNHCPRVVWFKEVIARGVVTFGPVDQDRKKTGRKKRGITATENDPRKEKKRKKISRERTNGQKKRALK